MIPCEYNSIKPSSLYLSTLVNLPPKKNFHFYPSDTQPNLKIIQNFLQKYFAVSKIPSTFAPAIERDAVVNMMERLRKDILSDVGEVGDIQAKFRKLKKNKKTSEEIWKFKIKVLTFATAIKNNDSD